jgi:formate-dependent nitrite reductase membrane component NrfD
VRGDGGGEHGDRAPEGAPVSHAKGAPPEDRIRAGDPTRAGTRDVTPAVGKRGEPGRYRRAYEGAKVALAKPRWGDARWSYLYDKGTGYTHENATPSANDKIAEAARRMREGDEVPEVQGPIIRPAVWTWEVPLYFWFGGIASGSSFVALACDVAGDHQSAAIARRVTLAAVGPCAPLLVMDLGRPMRFLNMMRIFKPRSPMSMGAWCLSAFSGVAFGAVAADLLGRPRLARLLGAKTAVLGTYLGSYTGVLLASTAVPVWARSRLFLGPIFIATATAKGAAANRLVLAATGLPVGHPTRQALGTIETLAMGAELTLSSLNEKRLGRLARSLEEGRPGRLFQAAKWLIRVGLSLRFARKRGGPWVHHVASVMFLLAGLCFRFAWVGAGRTSALDHEAVARMHRTEKRTT